MNDIESNRWLRMLPGLFVGVISLAIVLAVYHYSQSRQHVPQPKKILQHITMIQPPPPVMPPVAEIPPEPKILEPEISTVEPEPTPEPSSEKDLQESGKDLGLDAEAKAGSDGFGLLANKGGRSLLGGSGMGGNAILWYGAQIKRQLEDGLQNLLTDTAALQMGYSIVLEVWVGAEGQISRAIMVAGSGNPSIDTAIRNALPQLRASIGKAPPADMPQPVKVRITSRI